MAQHPQSATPLSRETIRRFLGRHLRGDGVEVGPGHYPYPLLKTARVRYVDRWLPHENRARFPELADAEFPAPHLVANFDLDRLAPLADGSCQFVVCSHVVEHLAEPIGFLHDIHRVLSPEGSLLLLVPDRRRTFDAARAPTPLAHLVAEHQAGVTAVDDDHVLDFLTRAGAGASYVGVPEDPADRARWFDWHRERSIHVHCWSEDEFPEVVAHTIRHLGDTWELDDGVTIDAQGAAGDEFGYVLRRSSRQVPPAHRADRFLAECKTWRESRRPVFTRPPIAVQSRATLVVDAPLAGAVLDQPFLVGGWALDEDSGTQPGVDVVEVWAVADQEEMFVAVAETGGERPDVAAAVGERGRTAGYSTTVSGLEPGPYDLIIAAHRTGRDEVVATDVRRVTVR